MSTAGKRHMHPGSPGSKLAAYFRDNPHEELSYRDALVKLDLRPEDMRALRMAVSRASRAGELESLYVIRSRRAPRSVKCPVCESDVRVLP